MQFAVTLSDEGGEWHYQVTLSGDLYRQIREDKATAEQCIEAAFEFLLDREPKEAILPQFDVSVIGRYFPEFETAFTEYLSRIRR